MAGGIPIIKALREGLVANRFPLIYGILNGTCNYILTQMEREGASYADVLADAKRLGYAEADESLDVQGWDTAHKAAVLAFLAHGVWVKPEQMIVEGITRITPGRHRPTPPSSATASSCSPSSPAISRPTSCSCACIRPCCRAGSCSPTSTGVYNGIAVTGDVVGTTLYIGRGAGQDATASAVISDIADAVTLLTSGKSVVVPDEAAAIHAGGRKRREARAARAASAAATTCAWTVRDQPGVLAQVATVMAQNRVSIESVIQTRQPSRPDAAIARSSPPTRATSRPSATRRLAGSARAPLLRAACLRKPPLLLPASATSTD